MLATAGDGELNSSKFALLDCRRFAVSVTPGFNMNLPVKLFDISKHVTLCVIVIVCPFWAEASSPTLGTTPPTHVAPALKLPLAADTMSAMVRVLSR
jgi:hypothetical protein